MYREQEINLEDIYENVLLPLNEQNKYIENYAINLYDLWCNGKI